MLIILILDEDNSLFALLMKIDKAIQDNDGREYIVTNNGNEFETPLQQRCQIMHTESLQEAVSASANNDFPTIALLSRPGLYPINTPEISYINQADCNREGVQNAQADLRSAVRAYARAFRNLNNFREEQANNNNIFGEQLSKYVCSDERNNLSASRLGVTQTLYYKFKKRIDDTINTFLNQITDLLGNLVRLQRVAVARRMGWGYLINNPNADFMVLVRHPSLLYSLSNFQLLEIPESWEMPIKGREERSYTENSEISTDTINTKFANYLGPITNSCIISVSSLSEMSLEIEKGQNQTFQIIALTENSYVFNEKLKDIKKIFYMWLRTARGWFTSWWWHDKFNEVEIYFLEWVKALSDSKCKNFHKKVEIMSLFMVYVEKALDQGLEWYYNPEHIFYTINENLKIELKEAKKCFGP